MLLRTSSNKATQLLFRFGSNIRLNSKWSGSLGDSKEPQGPGFGKVAKKLMSFTGRTYIIVVLGTFRDKND